MRREGYEFEVGRPEVVFKQVDGSKHEPYEEVTVEVPLEHVGTVQSEFGKRRAILIDQQQVSDSSTRIVYEMPTRALLGLRSILITATKGTLIMHSIMLEYRAFAGELDQQRNGVLIAWENGDTTSYSLQNAEPRGELFVGPGTKVYCGQIIGLNKRSEDMDINITKEKHLTNMRSSSSDGTVQLTPPTIFSLEQNLDFLEDDELLEVTPKNLRLRKRALDRNQRKR
jgi:GTP-binding protein